MLLKLSKKNHVTEIIMWADSNQSNCQNYMFTVYVRYTEKEFFIWGYLFLWENASFYPYNVAFFNTVLQKCHLAIIRQSFKSLTLTYLNTCIADLWYGINHKLESREINKSQMGNKLCSFDFIFVMILLWHLNNVVLQYVAIYDSTSGLFVITSSSVLCSIFANKPSYMNQMLVCCVSCL